MNVPQCHRRNLTEAKLLTCVEVSDQMRSHNGEHRPDNFEAPTVALKEHGKSP